MKKTVIIFCILFALTLAVPAIVCSRRSLFLFSTKQDNSESDKYRFNTSIFGRFGLLFIA